MMLRKHADVLSNSEISSSLWCYGVDLPTLLHQTLQGCHTVSSMTGLESLMSEFSDVFREESGNLHGIEATINVEPNTKPCFYKQWPVPFTLREKVETLLKSQVEQGELCLVDRSDWVTPHC